MLTLPDLPTKHLMLTTSIVTFGICLPVAYQNTILNVPQTIFEQFENKSFHGQFGSYLDETSLASLWGFTVSSSGLSSLLSSFAIPYACRRYGRRNAVFYFGALVTCVGGVFEAVGYYCGVFELFIIGLMMSSGIGSTFAFGVGPVYVSECSPPEYRGFVSTIQSFGQQIGMLLAFVFALPNLLGTKELLHWYVFLPSILCAGAMLFMTQCSDSPKDLHLFRQETQEATKAIDKYYGSKINAKHVLQQYDEEVASADSLHFSAKRILKSRQLRKPILIIIAVGLFNLVSGPAVLAHYSTLLFQSVYSTSADTTAKLLTIALTVPGIPISMVSALVVDKWGRRPLLIGGGFMASVLLAIFTVAVILHKAYYHVSNELWWLNYLAIGSLFLSQWVNTFGPDAVGGFLHAELVPQQAMSGATMILWVTYNLGYIVTNFLFPCLHVVMGIWAVVIICIIPSFLLLAYLCKVVPETKNRPINEIVALWDDDVDEQNGKEACESDESSLFSRDIEKVALLDSSLRNSRSSVLSRYGSVRSVAVI